MGETTRPEAAAQQGGKDQGTRRSSREQHTRSVREPCTNHQTAATPTTVTTAAHAADIDPTPDHGAQLQRKSEAKAEQHQSHTQGHAGRPHGRQDREAAQGAQIPGHGAHPHRGPQRRAGRPRRTARAERRPRATQAHSEAVGGRGTPFRSRRYWEKIVFASGAGEPRKRPDNENIFARFALPDSAIGSVRRKSGNPL
jgi:hypothetical protein